MIEISNKHYRFKYNDRIPENNIINPIIENKRYKIYRKFQQEFIDFFVDKKMNKYISEEKQRIKIEKSFSRWIMLQISLGNNIKDPIIPSVKLLPHPQLEEDIINFTRDKEVNKEKLLKELKLNELCKKYNNEMLDFIKKNGMVSFDKRIKISVNYDEGSGMYILGAGLDTRFVEVSKIIHDRTKILFTMNQSFCLNLHNEEVFYYLLYCLMLRYITISEDGTRQGCLNMEYFSALHDEFNINFEGFAASFAASCDRTCSLFYDIEKYFGSVGNFFELVPIKGIYNVNPPLDSLITTMAMEKILDILVDNNNEEILGFIVYIPTWDKETLIKKGKSGKLNIYEDFPIYEKLKKSTFLLHDYDIINKKMIYVQYQGKYHELEPHDCPHIMILGNKLFKDSFDIKKMVTLLDTFTK